MDRFVQQCTSRTWRVGLTLLSGMQWRFRNKYAEVIQRYDMMILASIIPFLGVVCFVLVSDVHMYIHYSSIKKHDPFTAAVLLTLHTAVINHYYKTKSVPATALCWFYKYDV